MKAIASFFFFLSDGGSWVTEIQRNVLRFKIQFLELQSMQMQSSEQGAPCQSKLGGFFCSSPICHFLGFFTTNNFFFFLNSTPIKK